MDRIRASLALISLGDDRVTNEPPDHFGPRPSERGFRLRIPLRDTPFLIHRHKRVVRLVDDQTQQ